jgi:hypothetical protein
MGASLASTSPHRPEFEIDLEFRDGVDTIEKRSIWVSVGEDGITKVFIASEDAILDYLQETTPPPGLRTRGSALRTPGFENTILELPC